MVGRHESAPSCQLRARRTDDWGSMARDAAHEAYNDAFHDLVTAISAREAADRNVLQALDAVAAIAEREGGMRRDALLKTATAIAKHIRDNEHITGDAASGPDRGDQGDAVV